MDTEFKKICEIHGSYYTDTCKYCDADPMAKLRSQLAAAQKRIDPAQHQIDCLLKEEGQAHENPHYWRGAISAAEAIQEALSDCEVKDTIPFDRLPTSKLP